MVGGSSALHDSKNHLHIYVPVFACFSTPTRLLFSDSDTLNTNMSAPRATINGFASG